jgi:hypothetical protein
MPETVVELIGVLGFFLACASLAWHVWTHRQAHRERVVAELSVADTTEFPAGALLVRVTNSGGVPLYLKEVTLAWGKAGDKVLELDLEPHPKSEGPLQVGQDRRFVLLASPTGPLAMAARQPEERLWISIKSARGEVQRVKGSQVHPHLAILMDHQVTPPGTPSDGTPSEDPSGAGGQDRSRQDRPPAPDRHNRQED